MADDIADFREMYMRRLFALLTDKQSDPVVLENARKTCNDAVRKVCYAFKQDANWRDYASPVHPHNLAETYHFEQQLERLKARERH